MCLLMHVAFPFNGVSMRGVFRVKPGKYYSCVHQLNRLPKQSHIMVVLGTICNSTMSIPVYVWVRHLYVLYVSSDQDPPKITTRRCEQRIGSPPMLHLPAESYYPLASEN